MTKLQNNVNFIEKDLLDPDDVSAKLVGLEDRSQSKNLQINGLQETPYEISKTCKKKVQEILKYNLGFAEVNIDRCNRVIELNVIISLVNIKDVSVLLCVNLIISKTKKKF